MKQKEQSSEIKPFCIRQFHVQQRGWGHEVEQGKPLHEMALEKRDNHMPKNITGSISHTMSV